MELAEYIGLIDQLASEKVKRRAVPLCGKIQRIACDRGINVAHISEVYKQLLDCGIVDINELSLFKVDVAKKWSINVVALDSEATISGNIDVDVEEF